MLCLDNCFDIDKRESLGILTWMMFLDDFPMKVYILYLQGFKQLKSCLILQGSAFDISSFNLSYFLRITLIVKMLLIFTCIACPLCTWEYCVSPTSSTLKWIYKLCKIYIQGDIFAWNLKFHTLLMQNNESTICVRFEHSFC